MIRAILDELRRAFHMTFNKDVWTTVRQGKSHPGWGADPHLRLGFLVAIPAFFGGLLGTGALLAGHVQPDSLLAFGLALLVSLAANVVWLGVSARSRRRAGG